jgi:hypothetical protein
MRKFADVLISNDVYIFGYPSSVGHSGQLDHTRPLLRKGIVAGKNEAKNTIILDCPVHQGNSGGLALQIDRRLNIIVLKLREPSGVRATTD